MRPLLFQVYRSGLIRKEWRWRLRAGNNRTIAHSGEGYKNKSDCLDIVALFREGLVKDAELEVKP